MRAEFIELGYDLFRDRDTLKSRFFIGDVFDETTDWTFRELNGRMDIIYAPSFFHLFNWEDQVGLAERVVRLLKPVEVSLVLGRQRGISTPESMNIELMKREPCSDTTRRAGRRCGSK